MTSQWRQSVWSARRQWAKDGKMGLSLSVKLGFLRLRFEVPNNLLVAFHQMLWCEEELILPLESLSHSLIPTDSPIVRDGYVYISEDNCGAPPWEELSDDS